MLETLAEEYVESKNAALRSEFVRLGLTDSVLLQANELGYVLLTADLHLYQAAMAKGLDARNFNHLREAKRMA